MLTNVVVLCPLTTQSLTEHHSLPLHSLHFIVLFSLEFLLFTTTSYTPPHTTITIIVVIVIVIFIIIIIIIIIPHYILGTAATHPSGKASASFRPAQEAKSLANIVHSCDRVALRSMQNNYMQVVLTPITGATDAVKGKEPFAYCDVV